VLIVQEEVWEAFGKKEIGEGKVGWRVAKELRDPTHTAV